MVASAGDSTPFGREMTEARQQEELLAFGSHSKVDSIVVNAPVALVYAAAFALI